MLRSLLISVDLSPSSTLLIGRAALLPLAADARLTLLHVVPKLLPSSARERAESDARTALKALAETLASKVPSGVVIEPVVTVGSASAEIANHAQSTGAELIVMGRGSGQMLRDAFLGSTAERVLRRGRVPVLVVRLAPTGRYARPALAIALDQAAGEAIGTLVRVLPPPRPPVTLIHAFEVPFRATIYPSLSTDEADEYRVQHQQKAHRAIDRLLSAAVERAGMSREQAPVFEIQIQLGSARTVIERAVEKLGTDLLVLGTHGHAGIAHAFLGSIAGDVLREVGCDALVVPPNDEASASS